MPAAIMPGGALPRPLDAAPDCPLPNFIDIPPDKPPDIANKADKAASLNRRILVQELLVPTNWVAGRTN